MLEVPRVTETSEYAQNNQAEFGLRRGGAEFEEVLGQNGVRETGRRNIYDATRTKTENIILEALK